MTRSACTSCSTRAGTFRIRRPNGAGESWMREIRTSGLTSSDRKRSDGLVFWRKPPANGHSPEPTATAPVADSTAQQYRRYELQFASGVPAGVAHEQHSVGGGDDGAADLFEMGLCINALTWVSANGITTAAPVPRSRRRTDRCSARARATSSPTTSSGAGTERSPLLRLQSLTGPGLPSQSSQEPGQPPMPGDSAG